MVGGETEGGVAEGEVRVGEEEAGAESIPGYIQSFCMKNRTFCKSGQLGRRRQRLESAQG